MKRTFEEKVILVGTLSNISFESDTSATADVTYFEYDREQKKNVKKAEKITFADGKYSQPVTRLRRYDYNGATLLIKGRYRDNGELTGYEFAFPGSIMELKYTKGEDEKTARFYFGYANVVDNPTVVTSTGKKFFKFSGSFNKTVKDEAGNWEKVREFINFSAWNSEKVPLADRAEKVISKGDLLVAEISEIKDFSKKDGSTGKQASIFSFDIIEKKKKTDSGTAPAPKASETSEAPESSASETGSANVAASVFDDDEDEEYAF